VKEIPLFYGRIRQYKKVEEFIESNQLETVPTDKEQTRVRNNINTIINKDSKWKYINLNPETPTIRGK
jgi:hypothetical protein